MKPPKIHHSLQMMMDLLTHWFLRMGMAPHTYSSSPLSLPTPVTLRPGKVRLGGGIDSSSLPRLLRREYKGSPGFCL